MERPPYLEKGDTVAIVSTARKVSPEEMKAGIGILESWGLEVHTGEHLYHTDRQFAGTVEERSSDLQETLDDPDIKAIFCARGGYGTVQLIDRIDFSHFVQNPKWIVGYSDVTVLHSHINRHFGTPTLHASMPVHFDRDTPEALDALHQALFKGIGSYGFDGDPEFDRAGSCQGELIGGNLSIIYSLTGTDSLFDPRGKLLFIEDLDEYLYHVDRMTQNLRKSGILGSINGLIVGGMSEMNDNEVPYGKSAKEIIAETMESFEIPVAFDFPAGHIPENRPLYFGVPAELEVGKSDRLSFL